MDNTNLQSIPCTVSILTFNRAKTLRKTLESVKRFQEIIVCDGGSSDGALDVAREYNCKIIHQDNKYKFPNNKISDFSGVRNQCIEAATYDWFLYVDSDEILSDELVEEIADIVTKDRREFGAYKTLRKYILETGEMVERASTYPNYQIRFFNLKYVNGFVKRVHERIDVKEDCRVGVLEKAQYVPLETIDSLRMKWDGYNEMQVAGIRRRNAKYFFRKIKSKVIKIFKRIAKYVYTLIFKKGKMMPFRYEYFEIVNQVKKLLLFIKTYMRS
jgi:glycosyltransferase involved in cell wall biosynthesis